MSREPKWGPVEQVALAEILSADALVLRKPKRSTVLEYAQAYRNGVVFPAVSLARIGTGLYLVDGGHRVEAALTAERVLIDAKAARMSWAQASSYAATANIGHGSPLGSRATKGRALEMFLCDPANVSLSHREVTKALGGLVGHVTVMNYRKRLGAAGLKGSKDREPGEVEAAAAAAAQASVVESARRHLVGLEGLYERMEDPVDRQAFLDDFGAALDRMVAAGNVDYVRHLDI
jgi:hypothetical protein